MSTLSPRLVQLDHEYNCASVASYFHLERNNIICIYLLTISWRKGGSTWSKFGRSRLARKGRVLKDGAGVHPVSPGCELEFNWGLTPPAQDFYNYISHSSTLRGATRRERGANERDTGSEGGGDRFFCPLSRLPPLPFSRLPVVEWTQVMEETKNSPHESPRPRENTGGTAYARLTRAPQLLPCLTGDGPIRVASFTVVESGLPPLRSRF